MAKKHKKKIYNTPKKLKHKHNNISVSQFIKSFDNLKCTHCQSILANHIDRYYCGKCNVSITQQVT